MQLTRLKGMFEEQTQLVIKFGQMEKNLQEAILAKDWETLERIVPELDLLSKEVETSDHHRHVEAQRIKEEAGLSEDAPFGELLTRVDAQNRDELAALYRELQIAVLRVKSLTSGIDSYVRGSVRSTNEMLGELFPEQKGMMYSRHGRSKPAAGHAMVLDHRL